MSRRSAAPPPPKSDDRSQSRHRSDGPAMRIIVPLQGVVQGRGGLVLGSLLPCALFYFLQLYLKSRHRPSQSPPSPPPITPPDDHDSESGSSSGIQRSLSRGLLSPRSYPSVSSRAMAVVRPEEESLYYVGYKRCLEDPYDPKENPNGVIQLGLAENQLSLDLVWEWLEKNGSKALLGGDTLGELSIRGLATYQPFDGLMDLKIAVGGFMGQVMGGRVSFNPSQMVLTAGATSAMEILSFCVADPGNAFLVPSPYYPGWDRDIKFRTGIELVPVPCRSTDNFSLSISALDHAYSLSKKRGLKIRAVLLSNPSNPTGLSLSSQTLSSLLHFISERNLHLISDEIFAGSAHSDSNNKFVSIAELLDSEEFDKSIKSRVHIIYGLSKDLSLPGFRVGVLYSFNETVLAAASRLVRFSSVSAPAQRILISMLSDNKFVTEYLRVNRERMRRMYGLFVKGLRELGIECVSSDSGFYCWADMSRYIKSYSERGERKLWETLLSVAKVNVTPGLSCHCIEPGWFRVCFTTLREEDLPVVLDRFRRVIDIHKSNHLK